MSAIVWVLNVLQMPMYERLCLRMVLLEGGGALRDGAYAYWEVLRLLEVCPQKGYWDFSPLLTLFWSLTLR
jgi:hypothetical protein